MEFRSEERDTILAASLDKLKDYHLIRQVNLENDVAPSLQFSPGRWFSAPNTSIEIDRHYPKFDVPDLHRPDDLEELAFWPVTDLAELIRTRRVSSLELTQM